MAGRKRTGGSVRDVEPGAILDVSMERVDERDVFGVPD